MARLGALAFIHACPCIIHSLLKVAFPHQSPAEEKPKKKAQEKLKKKGGVALPSKFICAHVHE